MGQAGVYGYLQWLVAQASRNAAGMPEEHVVEQTWQGVVYRVGSQRLITPLSQVTAILSPPKIVRVPGVKPWVHGLSNLRGELTAIYDLGMFLYGKPTQISRETVVLVTRDGGTNLALMVDKSFGIRRFPESGRRPLANPPLDYCVESAEFEAEMLPIFDLNRLLESQRFSDVVAA